MRRIWYCNSCSKPRLHCKRNKKRMKNLNSNIQHCYNNIKNYRLNRLKLKVSWTNLSLF